MYCILRTAGAFFLLVIIIGSSLRCLQASAMDSFTTPQNDCCCNCENGLCSQQRRVRYKAHGVDTLERFDGRREPRLNITATTGEDPICNSELLRKIIRQHITKNMHTSKRAIHMEAEIGMGNKFAVICSETTFSYLATTGTYCQEGNDKIRCYAFQYA